MLNSATTAHMVEVVGTLLTGRRLVLRECAMAYWPAVHAYSVRHEVVQYQPWGPNTPDESQAFVAHAIVTASAVPRTEYQVAVTLKDGARCIGTSVLWIRSVDHRQGEIGYFLHSDGWGRGFATEAAELLLGFGFTELRLHHCFATCGPRNVASARIA